MSLLIDGHNLIPKIPGITLRDVDDESRLIQLLQAYCQRRGKRVEVFFDRAPVGQAGTVQFGQVRAHYVREGMTADDAIMRRLQELGKRARNYRVVSSDRQVQQAARAVHAKVVSSSDFASELHGPGAGSSEVDNRGRLLSPEEVAEWEQLFRHGHPRSDEEDKSH
jgi:hypothetical protein